MPSTRKMIFLAVLIVVLIFLWIAFYYFLQDIGQVREIEAVIYRGGAEKATLKLETATDPISQAKGLSGRDKLQGIDGMLFVFDSDEPRVFWMAGMRFSLDIVWIKDNAVIGIEYDVPPYKSSEGMPEFYESPGPVDKVLELPAGEAERIDLQIGDRLK
ncbi:MAG TPA: DUF192 domain-containing protein [Candidatus Colwellbacteria bacterium]|nr:DUF192 domain-containing protein [Candidatus Colwellbacteria bacterium]